MQQSDVVAISEAHMGPTPLMSDFEGTPTLKQTEGRSRISSHSWLRKMCKGRVFVCEVFLANRNFQHFLAG